jgi:hypothetical protein
MGCLIGWQGSRCMADWLLQSGHRPRQSELRSRGLGAGGRRHQPVKSRSVRRLRPQGYGLSIKRNRFLGSIRNAGLFGEGCHPLKALRNCRLLLRTSPQRRIGIESGLIFLPGPPLRGYVEFGKRGESKSVRAPDRERVRRTYADAQGCLSLVRLRAEDPLQDVA